MHKNVLKTFLYNVNILIELMTFQYQTGLFAERWIK